MTKTAQCEPLTTLFPVVAAALIDDDGRVLVQRRPAGKEMAGLWEFPGGKIEPGEGPEDALVRELAEELGIVVSLSALMPLTFASTPLGAKHLLLLLYICRSWRGHPAALHAEAIAWQDPHALRALAMPPADLPFISALETLAFGDHTNGIAPSENEDFRPLFPSPASTACPPPSPEHDPPPRRSRGDER